MRLTVKGTPDEIVSLGIGLQGKHNREPEKKCDTPVSPPKDFDEAKERTEKEIQKELGNFFELKRKTKQSVENAITKILKISGIVDAEEADSIFKRVKSNFKS